MKPKALKTLQTTLWKSADDLRANSDLRASEYSTPVMGLIFLKFADNKYRHYEAEILTEYQTLAGTRREKPLHEIAIATCGFYLPQRARYDYLLNLPEEAAIDQALKAAMAEIEKYKPELQGVLPQDEYFKLTRTDQTIPSRLLQNFANIPDDAEGDLFGQIYEYFLSNFALAEGQGGGEFFTPRSVVRLMVEIIEPHQGAVFDPACGSGGMFVQSAAFVDAHRKAQEQQAADALFVYGQEKTLETVKLAKMNLVVNGLRGEVRQTNTYYEDPFQSLGRFDYVLTNPPFNVDDVNVQRIEDDPRFNTYGIPRKKGKASQKKAGNETVPNANYLWINLFATALKENGRAALVMANSASDARHSEAEIRKNLIENNLIYGLLTLPSNMFWTVTLPATLWFFDKGKGRLAEQEQGNEIETSILFIDARNIFTQIDRAHREFSPPQICNLSLISHLHRGQRAAFIRQVDTYFAQGLAKLGEVATHMPSLTAQWRMALDSQSEGQAAVETLTAQWATWASLQTAHEAYKAEGAKLTPIEAQNAAQQQRQALVAPFFADLQAAWQPLDQILRQVEAQDRITTGGRGRSQHLRALKQTMETCRAEVQAAEAFFKHIHWLQERFPQAAYEDVTGLCKRATLDEVREQDYSLNPGRYVGVVIEEDGQTEAEFRAELLGLQAELERLSGEAHGLTEVIGHNLKELVGNQ